MIARMIVLLVMCMSLLCSATVLAQPDAAQTQRDTVVVIVHEDSSKQGDDCCDERLDALEKEVERRDEERKREIDRRLGDSQWRTDLFLTIAGLLIGLVTLLVAFLGRKALVGWIQKSISDKTDYLATQHLEKLKAQGDKAVKDHLAKLDQAAEERFARLDRARSEYESLRNSFDDKFEGVGAGRAITEVDDKTKSTAVSRAIPRNIAEQLSSFEAQLMVLKKLETEYTAEDWFLRGVAATDQGDSDSANRYFTESIKLDATSTKSYNNRGNALQRLGRLVEALADYNKALEVDPTNATAMANKAGVLGAMGLEDESLEAATLAIELNPGNAMAYLNRGATLSGLNRHGDALKDYNKAIDLDPQFALAYCNRGTTLKIQGKLKKSLGDLSTAIEIDPGFAEAYNGRGNTLKAMNREREALNDYNEAVRLRPKMTAAYMNRGLLHQGMGRLKEAFADFEYAMKLAPDDSAVFLMVAEVSIQLNDHRTALKRASEGLSVAKTPDDTAVSAYLKLITEKLLGFDTLTTEAIFEKAIQVDFETSWTTEEIEGWLKSADISNEAREFIRVKTELLKAKKRQS